MTAKDTYEHIYHLVRLYRRSVNTDSKMQKVAGRLLSSWLMHEPVISLAAWNTFISNEGK